MPIDRAVTIRVDYTYRDGYHVFSSSQLQGMYVVSRDAEAAYADVADVIRTLLKENHKIDCAVESAVPFDEFIKEQEAEEAEPLEIPHPAILRSQEFVLRELPR